MTRNLLTLEKNILTQLKPADLPNKAIFRVHSPYRPFKSRMMGYKNDSDHIVVVAKIKKGGPSPCIPSRGRTPSNIYKRYTRNISHYDILKARVNKVHSNMKVKAGYMLMENGSTKWFEFILVDRFLLK